MKSRKRKEIEMFKGLYKEPFRGKYHFCTQTDAAGLFLCIEFIIFLQDTLKILKHICFTFTSLIRKLRILLYTSAKIHFETHNPRSENVSWH